MWHTSNIVKQYTSDEMSSVKFEVYCIGKAKLWPLCLNCMEPAGFRFAVYKWFRQWSVEQLLWNTEHSQLTPQGHIHAPWSLCGWLSWKFSATSLYDLELNIQLSIVYRNVNSSQWLLPMNVAIYLLMTWDYKQAYYWDAVFKVRCSKSVVKPQFL